MNQKPPCITIVPIISDFWDLILIAGKNELSYGTENLSIGSSLKVAL